MHNWKRELPVGDCLTCTLCGAYAEYTEWVNPDSKYHPYPNAKVHLDGRCPPSIVLFDSETVTCEEYQLYKVISA